MFTVAFCLLGEIITKEIANLKTSDLANCSDTDAVVIRRAKREFGVLETFTDKDREPGDFLRLPPF